MVQRPRLSTKSPTAFARFAGRVQDALDEELFKRIMLEFEVVIREEIAAARQEGYREGFRNGLNARKRMTSGR